MQEEVENRTLTLVVSGTKFTGRMFKAAISKYMAHRKEKKLEKQRSRDAPVVPHGKQTVKQLVGQNQGISNIEITDPSIKEFEKIARKYGVDYAVKKDRSSSPPKYLIFFKGRDADALTAAFTEYTNKKVKKATKTERPSVLAKLNQFKEMVAEHEADILLHKASKKYFDDQGLERLPTYQSLQKEYAELRAQKKSMYSDYKKAQEKMRELQTSKANIDRILNMEITEAEKGKEAE